MLGYGEIWIIPEFRNEMRASLTPVQLLTIERTVQTRSVSMVTENQIVLMSRYAKQLLQSERYAIAYKYQLNMNRNL